MGIDALWREDATEDDLLAALQEAVNTGTAWKLEGHVGRSAMAAIENGQIALGETGHYDYWHNYVPSRTEVEPGSKGSAEFVLGMSGHVV